MAVDPCEQWEEQLSALLDGELDEAERRALEEHLSGCAACREYLADLTAIREAMEVVPAPEGFAQSVADRVAHTEQDAGRKVIPWRRWGLLAACCALALLGLWRSRADAPSAPVPASARSAAVESGADLPEARSDVPEEARACPGGADGEDGTAEGDADPKVLLEGALFMVEDTEPEAGGSEAELVDRETAAERFGHPLAPCTAEGFQGYSLRWSGSGEDGVCTDAVYQFADGTVSVRDQDRAGHVPPAEDCESAAYGGEDFYVGRAPEGGELLVLYFPSGETGLSYEARFDAGADQNEVFELLLSLVVS